MYYKMSKFEKRFGKYAIPNLTFLLIVGYAVGYIMELINADFLDFLCLDPIKILHGQVWRLFTWLIIPPTDSNFLFVLLMLLCCYSIGRSLESAWGTYKYNVYIFGGILLTIISSFLCYGTLVLLYGSENIQLLEMMYPQLWYVFGTYYINISIYLGYAMTYPNRVILLYMIIPVRMKWMGLLDLGYMIYLLVYGNVTLRFAVGAALLNVAVFYLLNFSKFHMTPRQVVHKAEFTHAMRSAKTDLSHHKCYVCERTDVTNPELQFRYCSKCMGNYEYCSDHLFTHVHVKS